jgi:nitrite reductase (NADH) large subunit
VVRKDEAKNTYRKLVIKDNVLVGAILLGDIQGSKEIEHAIKAKKELSPLKNELAGEHFDFKRLL